MASETDVSDAQSFDVGAFLNNLANTGVKLAAQSISSSQNNGNPSVTTTPNVRAGVNGAAVVGAGLSTQTIAMIAIGAAAVLAIVFLAKK